jgi:hypothetical protein
MVDNNGDGTYGGITGTAQMSGKVLAAGYGLPSALLEVEAPIQGVAVTMTTPPVIKLFVKVKT